MESVESAWRDKRTKCNYKLPITPALAPQVCRVYSKRRHFPSLFCAAAFQTIGVLSQCHAWSPRLANLQVDHSVCAVALHGVELQVPLEVLGVETRDGQTVAEASLHRDREGIKGLRRLCSLSHRKQQRYNGTNKVFCQVCFVFVGYSFFFWEKNDSRIFK